MEVLENSLLFIRTLYYLNQSKIVLKWYFPGIFRKILSGKNFYLLLEDILSVEVLKLLIGKVNKKLLEGILR